MLSKLHVIVVLKMPRCPVRLALVAALEGKFGEVTAMIGLCCSSWISMSRGSSHRSFLNPMGYTVYWILSSFCREFDDGQDPDNAGVSVY